MDKHVQSLIINNHMAFISVDLISFHSSWENICNTSFNYVYLFFNVLIAGYLLLIWIPLIKWNKYFVNTVIPLSQIILLNIVIALSEINIFFNTVIASSEIIIF